MNPTERNAVIRECIAALPKMRWVITHPALAAAIETCRASLEALLSPTDQGEASEPLQSAQEAHAPVDHGPGADAQGEAGTEWGQWIAIIGEKPEGLKDEDEIIVRWSTNGVVTEPAHVGMFLDTYWVKSIAAIRLRADHPHYQQQPDWTPDERTVRYCIEKLPAKYREDQGIDAEMASYNEAVDDCRTALESLLPKQPDPAEELARELWIAFGNNLLDFEGTLPDVKQEFVDAARHLVGKGKLA